MPEYVYTYLISAFVLNVTLKMTFWFFLFWFALLFMPQLIGWFSFTIICLLCRRDYYLLMNHWSGKWRNFCHTASCFSDITFWGTNLINDFKNIFIQKLFIFQKDVLIIQKKKFHTVCFTSKLDMLAGSIWACRES